MKTLGLGVLESTPRPLPGEPGTSAPKAVTEARPVVPWGPTSAAALLRGGSDGARRLHQLHDDPAIELDSASLERWRTQAGLMQLANSDLGPAAQSAFVSATEQHLGRPTSVRQAAKVATLFDSVRQLLGKGGTPTPELSRFFGERGFAMQAGEVGLYQLDFGRFERLLGNAKLDALEDNQKTELKVMVAKTLDPRDLRLAQRRVKQAVAQGELAPRMAKVLLQSIADNLGSRIQLDEVRDAFRAMRGHPGAKAAERFGRTEVDAFKALLEAEPTDPHLLFLGQRLTKGSIERLIAETQDPNEQQRLVGVAQELADFFAERTSGHLDHYGELRQLRRQSPGMTLAEYRALKVAVFASRTPDELAAALRLGRALGVLAAVMQAAAEQRADEERRRADDAALDREHLERLMRFELTLLRVVPRERSIYEARQSALRGAFDGALGLPASLQCDACRARRSRAAGAGALTGSCKNASARARKAAAWFSSWTLKWVTSKVMVSTPYFDLSTCGNAA